MTFERSLELAQRAREIGDQLLIESLEANKNKDLKKLNYLVQESIVLKKITKNYRRGCIG